MRRWTIHFCERGCFNELFWFFPVTAVHYEVFSKCDSSSISCYSHKRKRLSLYSRLAVFFDCDNKLETTGEPMFTGKGLTLMSCVRDVNVFILAVKELLNSCFLKILLAVF